MPRTLANLITDEGVALDTDAGRLRDRLAQSVASVYARLPRRVLSEYADEQEVPTSGLDVRERYVVSVYAGTGEAVEAQEIAPHERGAFGRGIHTLRTRYAFYRLRGSIYVLQGGSTSAVSGATCAFVPLPAQQQENAVTIGFFPYTVSRLVALDYVIRKKENDIRQARIDDLPAAGSLTAGTLPTVPAAPSFSYANATAASAAATFTPVTDPSFVGVDDPDTEKPLAAPTVGAITDLADRTAASGSLTWTDFDGAADDDDSEMAEVFLSKVRTTLDKFLADIRESTDAFQAAFAEWEKKEAEKVFLQARLDSEFDQGTFQADIQRYRAEVERVLGAYRAEVEHNVQEARIDLEEEVANARLATDVAMQNAVQNLGAQVQEYSATLQRSGYELERFMAEHRRQMGVAEGKTALFVAKVKNLRFELSDTRKRFDEILGAFLRTKDRHVHRNLKIARC